MKSIVQLTSSAYLFCALILFNMTFANDEITIPVSGDNEISVERYQADGQYLIVWIAPEYGFRATHSSLAKQLAKVGIETWQTDIAESLFLTQGTTTMRQLKGKHVDEIIDFAHKTTSKKILLAGDSYAAIPALYGAHLWQKANQDAAYLIGILLFSPYLYANIPSLGQTPQYMPVVPASNIPLMIYQTANNGSSSQFATLLEQLQLQNNTVYSKIVPDIMSLFYVEQPTAEMVQYNKTLPTDILKVAALLEKHPIPSHAIPLTNNTAQMMGMDRILKPFTANQQALRIKLQDSSGLLYEKPNYKGQVTVVNFWATWCAPCVQEIPSLNRLKSKMAGRPFELISINYAEDKQTIIDFMQQVNVDFPVLLDPNGNFATQWNVITYPSTFVIDTNGKIQYGVNAAIEWDEPELIDKLNVLLKNLDRPLQ